MYMWYTTYVITSPLAHMLRQPTKKPIQPSLNLALFTRASLSMSYLYLLTRDLRRLLSSIVTLEEVIESFLLLCLKE
jgi:hypothetical protein